MKETREINFNDMHTKYVIETVNQKMIDFIVNSDGHIDEFYKTLNREELMVYAHESKRLGDTDTFNKLLEVLK